MNAEFTQVGNVGGVNRLVMVSDDDFLSLPDFLGEWEDIILKDDATVIEVLFAPNTCSLDVLQAISANGFIYNPQIVFSKPKITKDIREWILLNAERKWVVFVEDYNFNTHICGVPGAGLQMQISQKTGNVGSSRNTNDVVLSGQMLFTPYIIENFDMLLSGKLIDLTRYATRNFKVMRGNSLYETFSFENEDGSLQILSDDQFFLQVRDGNNNVLLDFYRRIFIPGIVPDGGEGDLPSATWQENGFLLNEDENILVLELSHTELLLPAGTYKYDLVRIAPDGFAETQLVGLFIVENNITSLPVIAL